MTLCGERLYGVLLAVLCPFHLGGKVLAEDGHTVLPHSGNDVLFGADTLDMDAIPIFHEIEMADCSCAFKPGVEEHEMNLRKCVLEIGGYHVDDDVRIGTA